MCSPPGRSGSAFRAMTFRSAPACRCSWCRSSPSPQCSSCATSIAGRARCHDCGSHHDWSEAPASIRQYEPGPAVGATLVVFFPHRVRDLLSDAAGLHAHHVAQDQRGDFGGDQPVVGLPSDAGQLHRAVEFVAVPDLLPQFRTGLGDRRGDHHADQRARRIRALAHAVLGFHRARDWSLPHLSDPGDAAIYPAVQDVCAGQEYTGIELINRWWVLLLLYPTLTVPFCTWIMIGYFASIPKELDEAALMDGANYRQILTRVFIPVALPGLIAATIFAFTVSWAQFLYPLAFTTSADQLVLPVGIVTSLIKGDVFNWGQIMTGALLGAAPPLIIYAFLMDYYIAGLTAGATKG